VTAAATGGPEATWYKDAIIYELHVRAFYDSNGDGIGDFRGLSEKLDYLQDLGVTAIWLLPFYPSPLKDDGYDIADYGGVHPSYGSLRDLKGFLRAAHRRGLRVITELVLNHTSDQHPWFRRARRAAPGTPERDFYVWSDRPDRYKEARIIFSDYETSNWSWDDQAQAYYWHRFYSHQPDLNFANPAVHEALFDVVDSWFELGVDGLRLDAVPYLYEREGTSCENLTETHGFLKELRAHVDSTFSDRMLLAEANQWPEDAVAYFGDGDECHMAFHFPVMPRMFMAVRMEDRFPVIDIMQQTPPIPDTSAWALFLRNHDELTLEMVTDEERDYMYRMYGRDPQMRINLGIRRRLAPLLGNNRRQIELMNGLLMSLPGTPVIYYGDELGMGDNIYLGDRNGVRTPMQWSSDRNAGFSRANPQRLFLPVIIDPEYHAEAINVEAQQANPHSLLWWMKRLIALRKHYHAFGRGSLEFLHPRNNKVLAFIRQLEDERILVVANLSRFVQAAELDLRAFDGMVPVELFGQTEFPPIGELPYFVTLGPHAFYWFALRRPKVEARRAEPGQVPAITVPGGAGSLARRCVDPLVSLLPRLLPTRRWFAGKGSRIKAVSAEDVIDVGDSAVLLVLHVEFVDGDPQTYIVPVSVAGGETAEWLRRDAPPAIFARIEGAEDLVCFDAVWDAEFARTLHDAMTHRRRMRGQRGEVVARTAPGYRRVAGRGELGLEPRVVGAEQSNSSVIFGDRFVLKLFRRLDDGQNPELEIGRFLTEQRSFPATPPLAGVLEYARGGAPATLGIMHAFVPNQGDAWGFTLDRLGPFIESAMAHDPDASDVPVLEQWSDASLVERIELEIPPDVPELIGDYLEWARLLGRRTAELHIALASEPEDPAFAPEPFTPFYQRSLYQSVRGLARRVFDQLRQAERDVPAAAQILDLENEILDRFGRLLAEPIDSLRIRTHGDFHLGQVLFTGKDFSIIDFEGEPSRPITARRIKRSPIADVAGMLRSFHYAAYMALYGDEARTEHNLAHVEPWILFWYRWVSAAYLRTYLDVAAGQRFVPDARDQLAVLLDTFLLEKSIYEVGYELNNRPDWIAIPIQGVVQILERRS